MRNRVSCGRVELGGAKEGCPVFKRVFGTSTLSSLVPCLNHGAGRSRRCVISGKARPQELLSLQWSFRVLGRGFCKASYHERGPGFKLQGLAARVPASVCS